jgi:hypothetical protein
MSLDLAYPKDDPGSISALAVSLTRLADDLRGAEQRLLGHRSGLQSAWKDRNGVAAAAEVETLADLGHRGDAAMTRGASALAAYSRALTEARHEIDVLRQRYQAAITTYDGEMRRAEHVPARDAQTAMAEAQSTFHTSETRIGGDYDTVMQQVRTAAAQAAATISQLATVIGVPPGGNPVGSVESYMDGALPSVHEHTMQGKAHEAAQLALQVPILGDEQLAKLLSYQQYANDPAFATAFHQELGPEGTLYLAVALTKMTDYDPDHLSDRDRYAAQLQQMISTTLAAATDPTKSTHLDQAWIDGLKKAGREKIDFGSYSFQPYGYQVLGVLMKHGTFAKDFLTDVGGDMYAFEQEHGGAAVWAENRPEGAMYDGFHLDLVDGSGGFDPMNGLMKSLANNPDAAKAFFTADDPMAAHSRVDYLLTDRVWLEDLPAGTMIPKGYESPGTDYLGQALDVATTVNRDAQSANLVSAVVHHLATDEQVREHNFKDLDLVPPNMRDSMGHMVKTYIGDVNAAYHEPPLQLQGATAWNDPALPGQEPGHAVFDPNELTRVLADTAKDKGAYQQMYDAQKVYTALAMRAQALGVDANGMPHPVGGHDIGRDAVIADRQRGISAIAGSSGQVFGALDYGQGVQVDTSAQAADAGYNQRLDAWGKAGSFVVDKALDKVPIPGLSNAADAYIDALIDGSKQDSSPQTNFDLGQSYGHSRALVQGLAYNAIYDNNLITTSEAPPASLSDGHGHLIAVDQMTDAQRRAYNDWITTNGQGAFTGITDADTQYTKGVTDAQNTLAPKDH